MPQAVIAAFPSWNRRPSYHEKRKPGGCIMQIIWQERTNRFFNDAELKRNSLKSPTLADWIFLVLPSSHSVTITLDDSNSSSRIIKHNSQIHFLHYSYEFQS